MSLGLPIAIGPLDHVGVAVSDIDTAAARYSELLGMRLEYREMVVGQPVEVAFLSAPGETAIELVYATDPESPIARFVERRGEGLHHVCYRVEDIERALADCKAAGVKMIDRVARPGARGSRIAFVHPTVLGGVLLELKQKPTPTA